eukprot:scaffold35140_cov59-Phaeocystis_antarctica.AAC.1
MPARCPPIMRHRLRCAGTHSPHTMKLVILLVSATFLATGVEAFSAPSIPGLKKCAVAPSGTGPCWELADPTMTDIPVSFLYENTNLTGTLKLGAAVKTIGSYAFYYTKLSRAWTCRMRPRSCRDDRVCRLPKHQAHGAGPLAGGLARDDALAFDYTDITGKIVTPFTVPAYTTGGTGSTASFPPGVKG